MTAEHCNEPNCVDGYVPCPPDGEPEPCPRCHRPSNQVVAHLYAAKSMVSNPIALRTMDAAIAEIERLSVEATKPPCPVCDAEWSLMRWHDQYCNHQPMEDGDFGGGLALETTSQQDETEECIACPEFVRMQHDIASLLGVDADTDSIDLHERIYGELSRRAVKTTPVEVWRGERKVSIYPDTVIRVWGVNIETEMSEAPRTLDTVQAALDWLYSPEKTPEFCAVCDHIEALHRGGSHPFTPKQPAEKTSGNCPDCGSPPEFHELDCPRGQSPRPAFDEAVRMARRPYTVREEIEAAQGMRASEPTDEHIVEMDSPSALCAMLGCKAQYPHTHGVVDRPSLPTQDPRAPTLPEEKIMTLSMWSCIREYIAAELQLNTLRLADVPDREKIAALEVQSTRMETAVRELIGKGSQREATLSEVADMYTPLR